MTKKRHLLLIDGQGSFARPVGPANDYAAAYKEQQTIHDGELCVPGGWDALMRVTKLIGEMGSQFDDMTFTFDMHQRIHIAHGLWFRFSSKPNIPMITVDGRTLATYEEMTIRGKKRWIPAAFTTMVERNGEIVNGVLDSKGNLHDIGSVDCARMGFREWTVAYLKKLFSGGRYPHMIWPPHCLIGTKGTNLVEPLMEAVFEWELGEFGVVNKVTKGSNIKTEHFGAVFAEVPDPEDPSTQVNSHFVELLSDSETEIVVGGIARGHCLANTVRDTASSFPNPDEFIKRLVLLTDGTADVPGLEFLGDAFVTDFTARGMQLSTVQDYMA